MVSQCCVGRSSVIRGPELHHAAIPHHTLVCPLCSSLATLVSPLLLPLAELVEGEEEAQAGQDPAHGSSGWLAGVGDKAGR